MRPHTAHQCFPTLQAYVWTFPADFRAFRQNMDSPLPSFRLIETQGRGGAGKKRFQGTGIRRRERKGAQAVVGDFVPAGTGVLSPCLCASMFKKRARFPSRCFSSETVVTPRKCPFPVESDQRSCTKSLFSHSSLSVATGRESGNGTLPLPSAFQSKVVGHPGRTAGNNNFLSQSGPTAPCAGTFMGINGIL